MLRCKLCASASRFRSSGDGFSSTTPMGDRSSDFCCWRSDISGRNPHGVPGLWILRELGSDRLRTKNYGRTGLICIVACCWPTALMWLIPFIRSTSIRKSQGKVYVWGRDLWLCARRTNPLNSDGSSKIVIERKTRSGAKDVSVQKNSKPYMLIRIIVEVKHRFDV